LESATTLILFRGFTNRVVAYRGTIINVDRQAGVAAPYAFVVLSLLISLLGIGTGIEAPKDIYPYINIPVVTIVWSYSGLPPQDMGYGRADRHYCERALTIR
jgi:hypothetical protein